MSNLERQRSRRWRTRNAVAVSVVWAGLASGAVVADRVWVARRNLPAPLLVVYLGVWTAVTVLRLRSPRLLAVWFSGFREGWVRDAGERHPMRWRTVWRLTRAGRPPVI